MVEHTIKDIEVIKKETLKLMNDESVHSVILFGSYASGEAYRRSDIDICIVAPTLRNDKKRALKKLLELSGMLPDKYDVTLFELLPLYLKIRVIEDGIVLHTRNILDLKEYFRFYRKIWGDMKHRQALDKQH